MLSIMNTSDTMLLLIVIPFFAGTRQSISDAVHLALDTNIDLSSLCCSEGCISASRNADTICALEELIGVWCHQVEQVLAQGSQIRKEADDSG